MALATQCEGTAGKISFSPSDPFYLDCHLKVAPVFRVGLPTLAELIRKILHRCARGLAH